MRDEWFYKSLGQEWGPLPFEEIAELAANERLAPDDEVRCGTEGDWVPAASIVGLFPEPEELSDLSELDFTFGQSGDVPQPERAIQIVLDDEPLPAPPVADQWYSHQFGQDLGPMSLAELKAMAAGGALSDNDRVRLGLNGDWLPAGAIEDLREALRSAPPIIEPPARPSEQSGATNSRGLSAVEGAGTDAAETPQVVTVDGQTMVQVTVPLPGGGTQIVTVPIQLPPGIEGQAAVSPPSGKAGKRGSREDQQWFWKDDDGEEHGPMGFDDLQRDAAAGKLRPGDDVKRGRKGVWGPASTLPDLLFPSKSLWSSTAVRQEEAPPRPQPMTTESAAPPAASPPQVALPSGFSSPAAGTNGSFGGTGAYGRPAAAPAPRARAAAKSKAPKASFNFDFSGLKETLGDQAKPLIAVAALGLVALLIYVPLPFGGGDQTFFDAYQAILTEFEGLRTRGASESEWTAFTDKVNQQNDQLVKDLEAAGAGSREPIKQQLLWAGRDYLIPMLSSARTKPSPDEEKFREHLQNASRMLKGGTLEEVAPAGEEGMGQEAMPEAAAGP